MSRNNLSLRIKQDYTLREFIRESLADESYTEYFTDKDRQYAILAIIADVIKKSDTFDMLGADDDERLLMVASGICAAGVTTLFGKSVDEGEAHSLQVLASDFFNTISKYNQNLASSLKKLDTTIGPAQIRFSHLAKPEFDDARKRLGIEAPADLNDMTKSILAAALFIKKNYTIARFNLGYDTTVPGNNPGFTNFKTEDSTGNAALDLAFCAYNGPTERVLVRWCKNTRTNKYEPCKDNDKDQVPARNFIPRFTVPGAGSEDLGTLLWVSKAASFLPFILFNLKIAFAFKQDTKATIN